MSINEKGLVGRSKGVTNVENSENILVGVIVNPKLWGLRYLHI